MSASPAPLAIWGATGQCVVLCEFLCPELFTLDAVFDNDPTATSPVPGVPLHHGLAGLQAWVNQGMRPGTQFIVAIGGARGEDRAGLSRLLQGHGLAAAQAIHPAAYVARDAALGLGAQVLARAVVGSRAVLGDWCIVNTAASVDHECTLAEGVHIGPGATLCGLVCVERHAFIGAGSVVLPRIRIGAGAVVGAGSVVTRDVPPGVVVAGNPARELPKKRTHV
jgi:sugar O-acyltransferase (sialic acid O-acetyltransferase NeuD family)